MDFFEHQDRARRNTRLLFVYLFLAFCGTVCAMYFGLVMVFVMAKQKEARAYHYESLDVSHLWNPQLFGIISIITILIMLAGSLYKMMALARGGRSIAESLGGRLLGNDSTDAQERKLLNVVEEMAIASGIPVPRVYLLDAEQGINAFAAGFSIHDAIIGVTRGAVQTLSRDELQGVIGHEFSHIVNGDMRLNLRLIAIVHGILLLGLIGQVIIRSTSRSSGRNKNGNGPLAVGAVLLIVGYVGTFFGNLIKSSISRQREFLADASSVQFTRNPNGLTGALQKIRSAVTGSVVQADHAAQFSHMYFSEGLQRSLMNLFATHPPLEERIARIEDIPIDKIAAAPSLVATPGNAVNATSLLSSVGKPDASHLAFASAFLSSLPDAISTNRQTPAGAQALVFAVALQQSSGEVVDISQSAALSKIDSEILREASRLVSTVQQMGTRVLEVVELAIPALYVISLDQYQTFRAALLDVVNADGRMTLPEYALTKVCCAVLDRHFGLEPPITKRLSSLSMIAPDCAVLIRAVAFAGSESSAERSEAFRAGMESLGLIPEESGGDVGYAAIDTALSRIAAAVPKLKSSVMTAVLATIRHDAVVAPAEVELFRAIGAALDCPVPPIPEQSNSGTTSPSTR